MLLFWVKDMIKENFSVCWIEGDINRNNYFLKCKLNIIISYRIRRVESFGI